MAKKWVQEAFSKNKGKLHRELGVKEGKRIPAKKLNKAINSKNPTIRKEASLVKTARGFKHK